MKRIIHCILLSLGLVAVAVGQDKPNVIFIMTDDQGYPAVGALGHP